MYLEYFYWHYVWAPRWYGRFVWTMQRALFRFFSVPLMLRTLFAHWHRDALPYRPGGIQELLITFAWNQISRAIGFIIRVSVLAVWAAIELLFLALAIFFLVLFLAWPLLTLISLMAGIVLLSRGLYG